MTQEYLDTSILEVTGVAVNAANNAQTDGISFRSAHMGYFAGDRDIVSSITRVAPVLVPDPSS